MRVFVASLTTETNTFAPLPTDRRAAFEATFHRPPGAHPEIPTVDVPAMDVRVCPDARSVGAQATTLGADAIRTAMVARGEACIVVATGASQFATLDSLMQEPGIAWPRVTVFHLDEYAGLPEEHPISFRAATSGAVRGS